MLLKRKFILLCFSLFLCNFLRAQIEIAHLTSKGFSATGFGGFLNLAVPVTEGNSVTVEAGAYTFSHADDHVVIVPFLLGYRHTFDGSGTGLYVEPTAGYSIGATDIQASDEMGQPIFTNGKYAEQKAAGITAGVGTGYIFPGRLAFNIGLRYQHVFVSKDPTLNLFSLRLSHSFSFRRRED